MKLKKYEVQTFQSSEANVYTAAYFHVLNDILHFYDSQHNLVAADRDWNSVIEVSDGSIPQETFVD